MHRNLFSFCLRQKGHMIWHSTPTMDSKFRYRSVLVQLGCFWSQDIIYEDFSLQWISTTGKGSHIAKAVACANCIDIRTSQLGWKLFSIWFDKTFVINFSKVKMLIITSTGHTTTWKKRFLKSFFLIAFWTHSLISSHIPHPCLIVTAKSSCYFAHFFFFFLKKAFSIVINMTTSLTFLF